MNLSEIQKALRVQNTCQRNDSTCEVNLLGETRPICSSLEEQECNVTNNCFWDGSVCANITPKYCDTEQAKMNISACRKGGNDFCYWQNKTCQVCNEHEYTDSTPFRNLISMDGRSCFSEDITCAPYFRQEKHAACRKYCELYQGVSANGTCEACEYGQMNGRCLNSSTKCTQLKGHRQYLSRNLQRYLGDYSQRIIIGCVIETFNVSGIRTSQTLTGLVVLENYSFANSNDYKLLELPNKTQYITYECQEPRVKLPYQPLLEGETGATYDATMEEAGIPKRLPAFICACPPGYHFNGTCYKCPDNTTTYGYNIGYCVRKCAENEVWNGTNCTNGCSLHQVLQTFPGYSFKTCVTCPKGFINIDDQCEPVPRSYYVNGSNELKRCENGTTTKDMNSFTQQQCNVSVPAGMKVNSTGDISANCDKGTYLENNVYCTVCDPGKQINASIIPEEANSTMCTVCPAGTYKQMFDALCRECEGPYTTIIEGATSKHNCTLCSSGVVLENLTCGTEKRCINEDYCIMNGRCVRNCTDGYGIQSSTVKECEKCPEGQITQNNMCANAGNNKNNAVVIAVPIVVILLLIAIALGIFFGIRTKKLRANKLVRMPNKNNPKQYTPPLHETMI